MTEILIDDHEQNCLAQPLQRSVMHSVSSSMHFPFDDPVADMIACSSGFGMARESKTVPWFPLVFHPPPSDNSL
jgi:hypothetical protein